MDTEQKFNFSKGERECVYETKKKKKSITYVGFTCLSSLNTYE